MAVSIDEVSKNSSESVAVAQRSVQIAGKGVAVVRQTIAGMDAIRDQIQETSKRIKRLGESSQDDVRHAPWPKPRHVVCMFPVPQRP